MATSWELAGLPPRGGTGGDANAPQEMFGKPDGWAHVWRDWRQGGELTTALWFRHENTGLEILSPYSQLLLKYPDLKALSGG